MMMAQNIRKMDNISQMPVFQELKQALEAYDFFDDPLIDSLYPQINADSMCIQVVRDPLAKEYFNWGWNQELRYKPSTLHLIDLAEKLSKHCNHMFPATRWFKGHFVCLLPNGRQGLHIDRPYWQRHAHRLVVPLVTNPECITQVEDDIVHMESGQLYEMNVLRMHGSTNHGKQIRVHLFLDYVPLSRWNVIKEYQEKNYKEGKPEYKPV